LYEPKDFGAYGAYTALFAILLSINSLRYEFAINLESDEERAHSVLLLTIGLVAATSIMFLFAAMVWHNNISDILNAPDLSEYLWLLPIALGLAGTFQALTYAAIRKELFTAIAQTKIFQSVSSSAFQIGLGFTIPGAIGLIVGQIVSYVIGCMGLLRKLQFNRNQVNITAKVAQIREIALSNLQMPLVSAPSSLLNSITQNLPRLLVGIAFGNTVLGFFAFSLQIISLPVQIVGQSIGQVFLREVTRFDLKDQSEIRRLFLRTALGNFTLISFPSAVLFLLGPTLFEILFGQNWTQAGVIAQILVPLLVSQFVVSPLSQILIVLKRQTWQMIWDSIRLILVMAVFMISSPMNLDEYETLRIYSGTVTILYCIVWTATDCNTLH
jgi:O-antigen/teichoic acid export membrane protein